MTDELPKSTCPRCKDLQTDYDGLGVMYCEKCGFCAHASITWNGVGKCDFCGELSRDES